MRLIRFFILLLTFTGCSSIYNTHNSDTIYVLSTTAMIHDVVKEIAGDSVKRELLIVGELDPHSYELVKGDDEKFDRATVVFYNGLGLEHGLSLRQRLSSHPCSVALGDILLNQENLLIYVEGQIDPHIWMDIKLWSHIVDPIVTTLSQLRPQDAALFEKNAEQFKQKLQHIDEQAYHTFQQLPSEKKYLVTGHRAFHYFVRRYLSIEGDQHWMNRCCAPEGLAPEAQISTTDLQEVIHFIEKNNVHTLFTESNVNTDALNKIVRIQKDKGHPLFFSKKPLFSDSMGTARSYLDMMQHNIAVILHGLES